MRTSRRRWFPLSRPESAVRAKRGKGAAAAIDPLDGPRLALSGRVVTMDAGRTVLDDATVYIHEGSIVAVHRKGDAPPAGFETIKVVRSGGTIFPGLIELHNHLAYNALPLWSPVPKRFEHRGQWPDHPDYRKLISGPMTVIGEHRDANGRAALLAPLVRYVECKALIGGVTTSQGIMLNSNAGIQRHYRGLLRNVENTADPDLPNADARIADVEAKDAGSFLGRLKKEDSCFLLHLSEGVTRDGQSTSQARKHFLALEVAPGEWAINNKLTCIHAAGLLGEDFDRLGQHGGSMVWSPMSNLLLYGATARVAAARAAKVRIGLGSDWSPSGSKNLLGELKVAWLYSRHDLAGLFTASDLVAMVTCDAAAILKWDKSIGSVEPGKRADLLVVSGRTGDPYEHLIRARETAIHVVMINGVARYGTPGLMKGLGAAGEAVRIGGKVRNFYLAQQTGDPDVGAVTLAKAKDTLRDALARLPELATLAEQPKPMGQRRTLDERQAPVWTLALDEISSVLMAGRTPKSISDRACRSTDRKTSRGRTG